MERVEGAQTPYEVYCQRCRVTFPVGTRRCVHCGGGIGGPALEIPFRGGVEIGSEDEEPGASSLRRFGGLAVWVLLAVSAVISNLCSQ